ncbi:glycosyltransferase [Nafulsella turpanensis]|uniref:glycosyltransferase n=1 Tax=Nafulsella turpanensis TaxID=1265690 RepID=UPI000372333D|nr:glycosyltransferase [Nafulsella turpanensis]
MKLLQVIGSMNPSTGGPCQVIRNSAPELEKQGVHTVVVCMDDPAAEFLGKDAFAIKALGPGKTAWCYSPKLLPWLLENITSFDAVLLHGLWLYPGYALQKAIEQLKGTKATFGKEKAALPKLFVMSHGMLDPYFQRASGRKFKALRNWIYWKLIEGKVINEAEGVLFTCKEEKRLARQPFRPYRPKKEINIGFGIAAPPPFSLKMRNALQEKCPELKNCPYILFLSRIHEKKGVDLLIKAYATLVKTKRAASVMPGLPCEMDKPSSGKPAELPKLVIAGPGIETTYGQRMYELVLENPDLRNSVLFPGMLNGDAKWATFYCSEVFILSSHQENFGIAVVEALACGKPVLISSQVNIWQEIKAAGAGLVAEDTPRGVETLLQCWSKLSIAEKLRMGRNGRELYKVRFANRPAARKLLQALTYTQE